MNTSPLTAIHRDDRFSLVRIENLSQSSGISLIEALAAANITTHMTLYNKTYRDRCAILIIETAMIDSTRAEIAKSLSCREYCANASLKIDDNISVIYITAAAFLGNKRPCAWVVRHLMLENIQPLGVSSNDMYLAVIVKLSDAARTVTLLKQYVM